MVLHFRRPRFVPGTSLISGFVFVRLDVLMFSVKVYRFLDLLYWVLCGCRVLLMLKLALEVVFEAFHCVNIESRIGF